MDHGCKWQFLVEKGEGGASISRGRLPKGLLVCLQYKKHVPMMREAKSRPARSDRLRQGKTFSTNEQAQERYVLCKV